jgi:hypothetical protein
VTFSEDAVAWRRERDRREPLKRDLEAERRALIRDFIVEALEPAADDLASCLMSLDNADDVGGSYHLKRVIAALKQAARAFAELGAK